MRAWCCRCHWRTWSLLVSDKVREHPWPNASHHQGRLGSQPGPAHRLGVQRLRPLSVPISNRRTGLLEWKTASSSTNQGACTPQRQSRRRLALRLDHLSHQLRQTPSLTRQTLVQGPSLQHWRVTQGQLRAGGHTLGRPRRRATKTRRTSCLLALPPAPLCPGLSRAGDSTSAAKSPQGRPCMQPHL